MRQMVLDGIVYVLWLLLPIIVLVVLKLGRASPSVRVRSTLAAVVLAIPAYLGLICLLMGVAWPPDIFFPGSDSRISVSVPDYRVEYAQQWGMDFYETYYEVTRQDGRKAFLEIDGDDSKCWTLTTREIETRVYFLCDENTITEQTSYFDKEQLLLYAGWAGCARYLEELAFRDYSANPLLDRSTAANSELYCP
jgi:hypothetical protein